MKRTRPNSPKPDYLSLLQALRADLITRLRNREPLEISHEPDAVDRGIQHAQRELEVEDKRRLDVRLTAVDAAIERIAAGTFGRCEECGDQIPEARLLAVPFAARCVDCQELAEQDAAAEAARCSCGGLLE